MNNQKIIIYYDDSQLTEQRGKHHDETGTQININRLDVGDFWQRRVGRGHECRHGKHSGYSEGDPSGGCVSVQPKAHPRNNDDQSRRYVDLNEIVAHRAYELDFARQTRVVTCPKHTRIHMPKKRIHVTDNLPSNVIFTISSRYFDNTIFIACSVLEITI